MAPPERQRVKAIFAQVADASPASRAGLLDTLCAGDDALRARVEALLQADGRVGGEQGSFLGRPAIDGAADLARALATDAPEPVGEVGAYTIVGRIGEGGMGAVYEAEQRSPKRAVALKLIRAGAATPALQRRMRREAQALGRLEHRGIARVYEAGSAPVTYADGSRATQPFIAMELVRGGTLLSHARTHELDDRARIELLARIAEAVQYAHQNGVIHRDLKPGNILVTPEGQPKILDFGVARLTDADGEASMAQTLHGQIVGTLAYMSPEQIAGDPAKIDTRCDVYALGVIGYELLSGAPPLSVGSTSLAQAARIITEVTPRSLGGAEPRFRGDVATIIDKALAKAPADRYDSAGEFGADLRRFLRNEPITARPPSTLYIARKFAARNKALVGAAVAVSVALLAGTVVSTIMAVNANRQRVIAEREAARSDASADFMREMLAGVNPGVARENDTTLLRLILDRTVDRLDAGELAGEPMVEVELRETIGGAFATIAAYDRAIAIHERAVELGMAAGGPTHPLTRRARHALASNLLATGRTAEAEQALLALRRDMVADRTIRPDEYLDVDATLGELYTEQARYEEAEPLIAAALEMRRTMYGEESSQVLSSMNGLAGIHGHLGRIDESIALYEQVVALSRRQAGDDHPNVAIALNNLAGAYDSAGRRDEGEAAVREAISIQRRFLGDTHPSLGMSLHTLASALLDRGESVEAEALYREAQAIFEGALPANHWFILQTRLDVGRAVAARGDFEGAMPIMREAYDGFVASLGPEHARTHGAAGAIAQVCEDRLSTNPSPEHEAERDHWRSLAED
jgi:serine/threonine protein kinase